MRFGELLAHHELDCDLIRPRHPVVCYLDLVGFVITIGLLVLHPQKPVVAILPISIAALYAISCAYHWLPARESLQKADHLVIAVVILVTYVPLWGSQLPMYETAGRLAIMSALFVGVCTIKIFFISWHRTGSIVFLVMGLFATGVSLADLREWLSYPAFAYWWIGLTLYLTQLVVYGFHRPDPLPRFIGYREIQHTLLLIATTLHVLTVVRYL